MNDGRDQGQDEEDEEDELYRGVNINLGRGVQMADVHTTQEFKDSHVTLTPVNPDGQQQSSSVSSQFVTMAPLLVSAQTLTPSTIATITTTLQAPTPSTTAPSTLLQDLPNFGSLFGLDHRLKTLEANFSEFEQMNQFARAVSSIPKIVHRYMDQRMNEAVKIIKEQVKEQVKVQIFKILPKIEQTVNGQLEAEVLTQSSNSSKTSYVVVADLSEMELKKILIEKMEGNKSIHRSNEQRNLYKALVEAYESDKIILDTYGNTVTLKRRRDDDVDKDEETFVGSDRGSKRRREGKEPESASAPKEKATRSAGKSTQGSKSQQMSVSESAIAEEPMQTTFEMGEPLHPEFETGADDQPIISKLAKLSDSRSSFNELMDTPVDFSNFLMNRLKVNTSTPELLAGPTYKLMKGSWKSLVELEFFLEEVYKATTYQLDWVNPEGYDKHALWGISYWGRKRQQFYGFVVNRKSARDVYSKRRIIAVTELKIVEWHNYKHLDWITVRRDDDKLYKFKEGNFKRLRIQDIGYVTASCSRKADKSNSRRTLCFQRLFSNVYKKHCNPKIDELHKFGDGTLTNVRTALDDRLKRIQMKYLPQSIWRKSDKDRVAAMIQAIDKRLKTRRIMRSLERTLKDGGEDQQRLVRFKLEPSIWVTLLERDIRSCGVQDEVLNAETN
nr:hypothetical protein [Tanacetum cinerariifolium]